jgi:hypothetical protein
MAAQRFPSLEHIPVTEPQDQVLTSEPPEPALAENVDLTLATTAVKYEIPGQWDDSLYANHWGINE